MPLGIVRKESSSVVFIRDGEVLGVVKIRQIEDDHRVRLSIAAPDDVSILRDELCPPAIGTQVANLMSPRN